MVPLILEYTYLSVDLRGADEIRSCKLDGLNQRFEHNHLLASGAQVLLDDLQRSSIQSDSTELVGDAGVGELEEDVVTHGTPSNGSSHEMLEFMLQFETLFDVGDGGVVGELADQDGIDVL